MNEIKVGQWARVNFIDIDGTRITSIGRVVKYQEDIDIYFIETSETTYSLFEEDFKPADNLVDLLEVGDIITLEWYDGLHLENEYILTESLLKNLKSIYVYGKNYKITAIELVENRRVQVIK